MKIKIMVVDDSLPMRMVVKKTIRASGFEVDEFVEASNGREALRLLRRKPVDLAIIDYNMPDMDGIEVVKRMKSDPDLKDIPVIIATVEGSRQRVQEFVDSGVEYYIHKPFTPEEVRDKLRLVIQGEEDGAQVSAGGHETLDF